MKIHLIFPLDRLYKASKDLLIGQINDLLLLIQIIVDQEYKVKELLAYKTAYNRLLYRALQIDYNEDLEQYSMSNFKYVLYKLSLFYKQYSKLLRPSYRLQKQIDIQDVGVEDYNKLVNNKPITLHLRASFFQKER